MSISQELDIIWANWFVGFCDGEGSFTYRRTNRPKRPIIPLFKLTVQDDHNLIEDINNTLFGGGYVVLDQEVKAKRESGSKYANRSELSVQDKKRLYRLVDFFDTFPLRSHKREEFLIWREMVFLYCHNPSRLDTVRTIQYALDLSKDRVSGMSLKGRTNLEELIIEWSDDGYEAD